MVGVPNSKGCLECIRLRVKCDEGRPHCQRCKQFGKSCPGYDRPLKFVHGLKGSHKVKHHDDGIKRNSVPSTRQAMSRQKNSFPKTTGITSADSYAMEATITKQSCPLPGRLPSPDSVRSQMFSLFLQNAVPYDNIITGPRPMRQWLSSIPDRLGKSKALDDALCCLVMHHTGCVTSQRGLTSDSRKVYGKALRSLQSAINKSSEENPTDIVCAASLLSVYELFACTDPDAWLSHADGMARLIQWRGVSCYRDPANHVDRAMLRALWGQMVSAAFLQNTECFLSSSEWQTALTTQDASSSPMEKLCDELRNYMALLPGIKRDGMALGRGNDDPKSRVLLDRAIRLSTELDDWYQRLWKMAEPIKIVPSQDIHAIIYPPRTDFPMSYQFADPAIGPLWSEYHASKIILNNLTSLDVKADNAWHAEEICKATHNSYTSIPGLFGPYHFAMALRIAYLFAGNEKTKSWVKGLSSAMAKDMEVMRFPANQETVMPSVHR